MLPAYGPLQAARLPTYLWCLPGYGLAQSRWLEPNAARWMLLHEALLNPVNAYFVLLAESGVPLYLAAALYLQIIHEPRSRLDGA